MTNQDSHVKLVYPKGSQAPERPHEQLDDYEVLDEAYDISANWQGISWAKGTIGDQLKRSASSAVHWYAEGYYADGGSRSSLRKGARTSCGEAAAAIRLLELHGKVSHVQADHVRGIFSRGMRMFARLLRPR